MRDKQNTEMATAQKATFIYELVSTYSFESFCVMLCGGSNGLQSNIQSVWVCLLGAAKRYVLPTRWYPPTRLHDVITRR